MYAHGRNCGANMRHWKIAPVPVFAGSHQDLNQGISHTPGTGRSNFLTGQECRQEARRILGMSAIRLWRRWVMGLRVLTTRARSGGRQVDFVQDASICYPQSVRIRNFPGAGSRAVVRQDTKNANRCTESSHQVLLPAQPCEKAGLLVLLGSP